MGENEKLYKFLYSLEDKEIQRKFKFIGEGISRKVYDLGNGMVLKLAKGEDGIYQNRVENYIFTHANPVDFKYLCPIIWYSSRMVIMKKAQPMKSQFFSKNIDLNKIRPEMNSKQEIISLAKRFFLLYEDVLAASSWGNLSGTNVLVDYGCTSYLGDLFYDLIFLFR